MRARPPPRAGETRAPGAEGPLDSGARPAASVQQLPERAEGATGGLGRGGAGPDRVSPLFVNGLLIEPSAGGEAKASQTGDPLTQLGTLVRRLRAPKSTAAQAEGVSPAAQSSTAGLLDPLGLLRAFLTQLQEARSGLLRRRRASRPRPERRAPRTRSGRCVTSSSKWGLRSRTRRGSKRPRTHQRRTRLCCSRSSCRSTGPHLRRRRRRAARRRSRGSPKAARHREGKEVGLGACSRRALCGSPGHCPRIRIAKSASGSDVGGRAPFLGRGGECVCLLPTRSVAPEAAAGGPIAGRCAVLMAEGSGIAGCWAGL